MADSMTPEMFWVMNSLDHYGTQEMHPPVMAKTFATSLMIAAARAISAEMKAKLADWFCEMA